MLMMMAITDAARAGTKKKRPAASSSCASSSSFLHNNDPQQQQLDKKRSRVAATNVAPPLLPIDPSAATADVDLLMNFVATGEAAKVDQPHERILVPSKPIRVVIKHAGEIIAAPRQIAYAPATVLRVSPLHPETAYTKELTRADCAYTAPIATPKTTPTAVAPAAAPPQPNAATPLQPKAQPKNIRPRGVNFRRRRILLRNYRQHLRAYVPTLSTIPEHEAVTSFKTLPKKPAPAAPILDPALVARQRAIRSRAAAQSLEFLLRLPTEEQRRIARYNAPLEAAAAAAPPKTVMLRRLHRLVGALIRDSSSAKNDRKPNPSAAILLSAVADGAVADLLSSGVTH